MVVVEVSESDGGSQGSAHSDRLKVVIVEVSVSVCDVVSVSDGDIVGVGVSDGGTVCDDRGVSLGVSGAVVAACGVAASLLSWARCSSANADSKKALSPD